MARKKSKDTAEKGGKAADKAAASGKIVFDSRSCSMTDAIVWAYENCGSDVGDEDAPSRLAWMLLLDFRQSKSYKQDLFKGVAMAKARKEETQENYGAEQFDGKAEYDILARLGGGEDKGVGEIVAEAAKGSEEEDGE